MDSSVIARIVASHERARASVLTSVARYLALEPFACETIMVGIKRIVDYNVRVRVKGDGSGVETDGVKMSINPFDEIALEEALRMPANAATSSEVVVVSHRPAGCANSSCVRDSQWAPIGQSWSSPRNTPDPLDRARVFHVLAMREQPGPGATRQAGDRRRTTIRRVRCSRQSGIARRRHLRRRYGLTDRRATVTREVDAGLETIEVDLPAVITTDLRLNEPRYVKLPDIMKAKKKPLEILSTR